MKKLIKKLIPDWLLRLYKKYNTSRNSKFRNMSAKEVFTEIYNSNHWKSSNSISGPGSELSQTESLINGLDRIINKYKFSSILDLPCGDFSWMQKVDLSEIAYIGADIVEELINSNIGRYKERGNCKFIVLNLITDPLPKSDVIIVRDCFVHLSYDDISNAIQNIKSSGSKYLLTTTFPNHNLNHDIVSGDWRSLNLQKKPFNFSAPILIINENCTECEEEYNDKSMALWDISGI